MSWLRGRISLIELIWRQLLLAQVQPEDDTAVSGIGLGWYWVWAWSHWALGGPLRILRLRNCPGAYLQEPEPQSPRLTEPRSDSESGSVCPARASASGWQPWTKAHCHWQPQATNECSVARELLGSAIWILCTLWYKIWLQVMDHM